MNFIAEIEKLKTIYRQNGILGGERQENSAEHSWHISIMAIILEEYCKEKLNIIKVIKMLLIHDIVEIYAGDTFLYDTDERENIKKTEEKASEKIFGLLPKEQKDEFISLWKEFEENNTNESRYAVVLDNLQPILNHYFTNNQNIKKKKLTKSQIINKKYFIKDFSEELWEFALEIINKSVENELYANE